MRGLIRSTLTPRAHSVTRKGAVAAALAAVALLTPTLAAAQTTPPPGGAKAQVTGAFGAPIPWTINGLHMLVLPSGKVMSYGTNEQGKQGAQFNYDIWDPAQGTGLGAHMLLPNTTAVNIFCSAQSIIPSSGEVLISGGDQTIAGVKNYSTNATNIFSESPSPELYPESAMAFARWYPSLVTMPNGTLVTIGGRTDQLPVVAALTPERYTAGSGWHLLSGISSPGLFNVNWYYPRAFVAPNGLIFYLSYDGAIIYLNPTGNGSIVATGVRTSTGQATLPTLMYAPGQVLSLRNDKKVVHIDVTGSTPVVQSVADADQVRHWSTLTVMADGKVLLTGGSSVNNALTDVAYAAQIWDPATGQWTKGASAQKARLYHSIALLLPDATVLTAAGGSPGPIIHLNGEIYYPPYLYKNDGSGQPARRPAFTTGWSSARLGQTKGMAINLVGGSVQDTVSRVSLVRLGSVTHTYNSEQRQMDVNFVRLNTASKRDYQLTMPTNPNLAVPGYYMLFVFNQDGVPSVAKIVRLTT